MQTNSTVNGTGTNLEWSYRNTPHESTWEKTSFLLFGIDCRSPSESVFVPPSSKEPTEIDNYQEQLMISLSSARETAASRAQRKYKKHYKRKASSIKPRIGQWVLVKFLQDESSKHRKMSRL